MSSRSAPHIDRPANRSGCAASTAPRPGEHSHSWESTFASLRVRSFDRSMLALLFLMHWIVAIAQDATIRVVVHAGGEPDEPIAAASVVVNGQTYRTDE